MSTSVPKETISFSFETATDIYEMKPMLLLNKLFYCLLETLYSWLYIVQAY